MQRTILLLAVVTVIGTGCNSKDVTTVSAAPSAPAPAAAAPANSNAAEPEIVASGPIVVENQVDVQALKEGVVQSILAQPGSHVRKGQVLARLDDRQISADTEAAAAHVRALEANVANWKAEQKVFLVDRQRAEKLYEAGVIPKEQLDHAVYKEQADEFEITRETEDLNNARDTQRSLQLEKDKTDIVAPFDGLVARRYVRVGQKIAVGDRLFWVTAMAPLQVKFTLPERYYGRVRQGSMLTLTSADLSPDTHYAAKVMQVSPVIDPSSGTMDVLAQVAVEKTDLRPGMLVNISLKHP